MKVFIKKALLVIPTVTFLMLFTKMLMVYKNVELSQTIECIIIVILCFIFSWAYDVKK